MEQTQSQQQQVDAETQQRLQRWLQLDNTLKAYNEKVKQLRDQRNQLEETILEHQASLPPQVHMQDGVRLRFAQTRVTEPITFRFLETSLNKIIKNPEQVRTLVEHLKRDRASKIVPEIKRTG